MQTPSTTRNSVLGKRPHTPSTLHLPKFVPPTPDPTPNPKRARLVLAALDGDGNKENVPPLNNDSPTSPRSFIRPASTDFSTPSRQRPSSNRSSSITPPATPVSQLILSTPPPSPSQLSLQASARALLRATCNSPSLMAGRHQERAAVREFASSFEDDNAHTALYISGSPGTGKTALVNSVLCGLDVNLVSINCMALDSIDALWERLLEELDSAEKKKTRMKKRCCKEAVDKVLSMMETNCIIVLDELDHIATSFESLVSLFSLPHIARSSLRIIGIANTHTLTSSLSQLSNPMHGVSGVKTLHFTPYTPPQLLEILQTRLGSLEEQNFLPTPTLTLLTKKVAALTGDVRSLFEVLRVAIDLAVVSNTTTEMKLMDPLPPVVAPSHVLAALKSYGPASSAVASPSSVTNNSEVVAKVRDLGLQCQLVMLAVLLANQRLEAGLSLSASLPLKRGVSTSVGGMGIDVGTLYAYYGTILGRIGHDVFLPVSRSEFGDLLGMLETVGLVALSSTTLPSNPAGSLAKGGKRTFGRSASFGGVGSRKAMCAQEVRIPECVRGDEVQRGLGVGGVDGGVREEEVRAIWEREGKRLKRDIERSAGKNGTSVGGGFESATED